MKWKLLIVGLLVLVILISGCVKVPIEKGDVIVKTDKIEYMQGENVSITIEHNISKGLILHIGILKFIENKWKVVNPEIRCVCGVCDLKSLELAPGKTFDIVWDQTICYEDIIGKFKVILFSDENYLSNEFIIK